MRTKAEFLNSLREKLKELPENDVQDILRDQEEYINDALSSGRGLEDVLNAIGDPKALAQSLVAGARIERARTSTEIMPMIQYTWRATFAVLALAPFNLVFVLGPFLALVGILVAAWAVVLALGATAVGILAAFPVKFMLVHVGLWTHLSAMFLLLACLFFSVLLALIMIRITQWFLMGTLTYLNWNLKFIRRSAA